MATTAQLESQLDVLGGVPKSVKDFLLNLAQGFNLGASSELTIASGAVTITGKFHTVDTESDGATDDLDTINGGSAGDILVLLVENGARTVVLKDGVDNLLLGGDVTLDVAGNLAVLLFDGTNWILVAENSGAITA